MCILSCVKQPHHIQVVQELRGRPYVLTLPENRGYPGLLCPPLDLLCLAHQGLQVLLWLLFDKDKKKHFLLVTVAQKCTTIWK